MSKRSDKSDRAAIIAYLARRRAEHIVGELVKAETSAAHDTLVHLATKGAYFRLVQMVAGCESIEGAQTIIDSFNP